MEAAEKISYLTDMEFFKEIYLSVWDSNW